jgi:hypothetical protein
MTREREEDDMIRRVGRPGLVGTVARTAVVAGTATAVSGGMMRHAQNKEMQQQEAAAYEQQQQAQPAPAYAEPAPAQPYAPPAAPAPPAAAASDDTVAKLQQLAELKAQGALTDEEFAAAKARLLGV